MSTHHDKITNGKNWTWTWQGNFYQFIYMFLHCIVQGWLVPYLVTCGLSKQPILWHVNISPSQDFDLQYISPHPQSNPHYAKCTLFTLSTASYEWEAAKCAEFFWCPSVNTGQLWLRAWKETEEKKNVSEWLNTQIWTGWQDLYLKFTLSLSEIPQNIRMLCFQLKPLAGV